MRTDEYAVATKVEDAEDTDCVRHDKPGDSTRLALFSRDRDALHEDVETRSRVWLWTAGWASRVVLGSRRVIAGPSGVSVATVGEA